jgi:hypothetical protein
MTTALLYRLLPCTQQPQGQPRREVGMKSERERPEIMWREIQEMSSGPMGLWGLEAVELGLAVSS